jgi:UDP-glucose 4-epimerase
MTRVLVTGATGFVGAHLCPLLQQSGFAVRAALRSSQSVPTGANECVLVGEIDGNTEWTAALSNVDTVIHLAARAHVLNDAAEGPRLCLRTNAHGTRRLAEEAARHRVRRLVYLSSVKVNGEETVGRAYTAEDTPRPQDAYASSKWHGERFLAEVAASSGMQAVVVRAPLVYGSGVHANFLRLLRSIDRQRWLPLGAVRNQRSLVSVWNLCDLVTRAVDHPGATGRVWMVSDGEDLSTPELVVRIARAMGRRPRLLPIPVALLRLAGELLGKRGEIRRLCGSLTVDIVPTRTLLGWTPPLSIDESLARTVRWYCSQGCQSS